MGRISTEPPPSSIGHPPASSAASSTSRTHDDEAGDHVLDFDEGAVGHGPLRAAHHLSTPVERLTTLLQMPLALQLAHPLHPTAHALLRPLRSAHRLSLFRFADAEEVNELAHDDDPHRRPRYPQADGPAPRRHFVNVRRRRRRTSFFVLAGFSRLGTFFPVSVSQAVDGVIRASWHLSTRPSSI
jgi:hypothetical protein